MIRPIGRFLVLFVIFTFLPGDVQSLTNFTFTGTLLCPKSFDYNVVLLEKDQRPNQDDRFNSPRNAGHAMGTSDDFEVFGQLSGDGIPIFDDGNFEIAILITHNCNTNVKPYRHFEIYLGSFAIKEFHFIENIGRIELFNKGEQTKDVIGKNRPSRRFKRA
ncbi:hypothetical protein CAEBREN_07589 [Caenorhabditis brenneri]|uniref:Transthyretin-like family protein n=1 Tax=Caenorhabditis brenneri TaxID=135651 RepID=G0MB34_CAEBE|nr:hypothetical protein CAEBREN_07589 [Caenorhabditis brenneri]